jgi:hypothetical protein
MSTLSLPDNATTDLDFSHTFNNKPANSGSISQTEDDDEEGTSHEESSDDDDDDDVEVDSKGETN